MSVLEARRTYDSEGDVLYLTMRPGQPGICEETLPGVFWKYSEDTRELVGMTFLEFSDYWMENLERLVRDLDGELHVGEREIESLLVQERIEGGCAPPPVSDRRGIHHPIALAHQFRQLRRFLDGHLVGFRAGDQLVAQQVRGLPVRRPRAARAIQNLVLMVIGLDDEFHGLVKVRRPVGLYPGVDFLSLAVQYPQLSVPDLDMVPELGLDHLPGYRNLLLDELGPGKGV